MASENDRESDGTMPSARTRLHGSEAVKAHFTLACGLLLCVVAFWFELHRALGGNSLSWAYVFEWPLLGMFAVYMWWKVINPDEASTKRSSERKHKDAIAPEFEGMLAAWEEHRRQMIDTENGSGHLGDD